MVIAEIRTKHTEQRLFPVDNDVIQTFSTDRTDHALDVSSLPRRPRGAEDFFDVHDFELLAELLSVDPVAVSQEILWCTVEWKRFDDLLRGPLRSRMSRDVEMEHASSVMGEHNEYE